MALHRISSITLGVPDVDASGEFFSAFGLDPLGDGRFGTVDGGEQLRLEHASIRGLRRLAVAADDPDDLDRVAAALAAAGHEVVRGAGAVEAREPVTGVPVVVEVAPRLAAAPAAAPLPNTPAASPRRDRPADPVLADGPVRPSNLTHLALGTPDLAATTAFFTDLLGFEVSDELPGIIAFTRCGEVHHNLALQQAPGTLVHHVAFEVDGVDDVARGGTRMVEADDDRHVWGLGRHAIGSNWFWYLREPGGTFVEYAADIDRVSAQDAWVPKEWSGHEFLYAFGPPPPPVFLEPADAAEVFAAQAGWATSARVSS